MRLVRFEWWVARVALMKLRLRKEIKTCSGNVAGFTLVARELQVHHALQRTRAENARRIQLPEMSGIVKVATRVLETS